MRRTSNASRLLSLVLCICMVLSMLPGMPLVAKAAGTEGMLTIDMVDTYGDKEYSESYTVTTKSDNHVALDDDGFCSVCGGYEAAKWNEEESLYEISNAGQLYWYAQQLNENNAEIFVKLTDNIVIPENAPNWVPINASYAYFNGNFKTISGLKCIGGDAEYVGLFGMEGWWYEISNLHITDSYFEGKSYVSAVVAVLTNGGSVTNCYVTNTTVQGDGTVGTLVGYLSTGSVINCFVDTDTLVGDDSGYGSIENSYYLSEEANDNGGKTAEAFASGEVAFLLQSGIVGEDIYDDDGNYVETIIPEVWGQTIGEENFPVFKGEKVYQVTNCKEEVGYSNTNTNGHNWVDATCTNPKTCSVCGDTEGEALGHDWKDATCTEPKTCSVCGDTEGEAPGHATPVYTNNGDTHSVDYSCCDDLDAVNVAHSYTNLICACGAYDPSVVVLFTYDGTTTGYSSLAQAIYDANILTDRGRIKAGVQLVLVRDAELPYSLKYNDYLVLWEGATLTINEGVTLTVGILTIRDVFVNNGTIEGVDAESGLNINQSTALVYGDGDYYVNVNASNQAIIYGGTFHGEVDAWEIYGGTFLNMVDVYGAIYGGTFQNIKLCNYGSLQYSDAVVINGAVYDYNTGNTAVCINGQLHTHTDGEITYVITEGTDDIQATHTKRTACTTCPFTLYQAVTSVHSYNNNNQCECGLISIVVSGVQISPENMTDVLGDGAVSYDPTTNTLTLNNADIREDSLPEIVYTIFAEGNLNLHLIGQNYLYAPGANGISVAMAVSGDCTVTGDGSLILDGNSAEALVAALVIGGKLTVADTASLIGLDLTYCNTLNTLTGPFNGIVTDQVDYVAYGDAQLNQDLTVKGSSFTVMDGAELVIADGVTLTIAEDATITNNGKVTLNGTFVNNGTGTCGNTASHLLVNDCCIICGQIPAKISFATASLEGSIAINFYTILSDAVAADPNAYMQFIMADGEVIQIPVSQAVCGEVEGETYYAFNCAVDAKEMTDDVICQIFYEGGSSSEVVYNVKTYGDDIIQNSENASAKVLAEAMLNYGAASQLHFGYNTDNLANENVSAPDYSQISISGFNALTGQGTELAKLYSASLILKSETTLRFFFTGAITAACNGQELEVKERNGLYYVDVVGIAAKDLDEAVTITINDGTATAEVSFNPMSYCQGVLNDDSGTYDLELKNLVVALYLYNQAANNYFMEG